MLCACKNISSGKSFKDTVKPVLHISSAQRRIFIFSFGGVDKYLGGCCCLLWPWPGGNTQKGQGKCLTKLVFSRGLKACMAASETIILVILLI
jgi:hypothetical protein